MLVCFTAACLPASLHFSESSVTLTHPHKHNHGHWRQQGATSEGTEALRSAVSGLSLAPPSPASSISSSVPALGGMAMRPRAQPALSPLAPSLASAASAAVCLALAQA